MAGSTAGWSGLKRTINASHISTADRQACCGLNHNNWPLLILPGKQTFLAPAISISGLLVILILGLLLAFPVRALPLAERHEASGLNSHFSFDGNSFAAYLSHTRQVISTARLDLNDNNREAIINANLPFELLPPEHCPKPSTAKRFQRGILLIHGLTDSPYWLRHLGKRLQQNCFYVLTILLPGNGTRPGDLLDVSWQDWVKAMDFGTALLKNTVEQMWLGGYSTGATLALFQASRQPDIRGLLLFSPGLRLSTKAAWAHWRQWFGRLWRPALWWQVQPDDDPYKYESFPINGAVQLYRLIQQLQTTLQQPPSLPILIAASEDDISVDSRATIELFKQWPHPRKKLLWFSREMQPQKGPLQIIDSRATDQASGHPVLSSSHISLLMPDSDPHYGTGGNYAFCSHYFNEQPLAWQQCKKRRENLLAETTPYFLSQGIVRRLTYNPFFEGMMREVTAFIQTQDGTRPGIQP